MPQLEQHFNKAGHKLPKKFGSSWGNYTLTKTTIEQLFFALGEKKGNKERKGRQVITTNIPRKSNSGAVCGIAMMDKIGLRREACTCAVETGEKGA